MRVLVTVIRHSIDGAGGSSRFAYDEALRLNALGHEVWMLAPTFDDTAPEYEIRNGIHFLRYLYRCRHPLDPRRFSDTMRATTDLLRRRAPQSFDLIHGHTALHYRAACATVGSNARACFSVHSPMVDETRANSRSDGALATLKHAFRSPILLKVERECLSRAHWVNCFSNFTKLRMMELHGPLAEKVEVSAGWTDPERFRLLTDRHSAKIRLGWRTDVPVLFTLRRLVPRMGLDRLLKAAHLLRAAGLQFQLVIGGRGPLRESLENLTHALGLADTILFPGFLADDDLPVAYGACDAFVLPTAELECFGIIAIEALASGRPVLATPIAAIPEILNRVEPRWLARSAEPEAIADLISDFLSHKLPAHCPERLRSTVQQFWNIDRLYDFCDRATGVDAGRKVKSSEAHNPQVEHRCKAEQAKC